jgi:putative transposase
MHTPRPTYGYRRYRFPAEIIRHGVWVYVRVCLSDRDVEAPVAAHGVILTDEAVRYGYRTFGQAYANQLRLVL